MYFVVYAELITIILLKVLMMFLFTNLYHLLRNKTSVVQKYYCLQYWCFPLFYFTKFTAS